MVKIPEQSRSLGQRAGLRGKGLTDVSSRVKFSISNLGSTSVDISQNSKDARVRIVHFRA